MMDCAEFLDGYSDFRDGLLSAGAEREYRGHLEACASCARYDRVVDRGASLYSGLPQLEPSEDFMDRLQHRLHHVEEEMRAPAAGFSGTPASAVLAIAAALAFVAWLPVLREEPAPSLLPPVAARAPQRGGDAPPLFISGPLLTHAALLDRGEAHGPGAGHALFGYIPVGAPPAIRIAALD